MKCVFLIFLFAQLAAGQDLAADSEATAEPLAGKKIMQAPEKIRETYNTTHKKEDTCEELSFDEEECKEFRKEKEQALEEDMMNGVLITIGVCEELSFDEEECKEFREKREQLLEKIKETYSSTHKKVE